MPIKRADGDSHAGQGSITIGEWRAAAPAETTLALIRAFEITDVATRELEIAVGNIDKRPKEIAKLLLAHATMTDIGMNRLRQNLVAHCSTLASASPWLL